MRSRGLVQVSDCYWDMSDEDAHDVDISLQFLAQKLSEGRCIWWTTCRAYLKNYKILTSM